MFNPGRQVDFAENEKDTLMGDRSTLAMLNKAFGDSCSAEWLTVHLADLNTFSGSKVMDNGQTKSLAKILAHEYKDVKYSIFMLFFYKFKCGYFGKFWGRVDPMVITCSLKSFITECEQKRQDYLNEELQEQQLKSREKMELRHKVESQWWHCQDALSEYCKNKSLDDVFSRIELVSYYCDTNILLLKVERKDYELIEGDYFRLFSYGVQKYLHNVSIKYQLTTQPKQVISTEKKSDSLLDLRERETAIQSAHSIIANVYSFDEEGVERLKRAFNLRYKHSPEEYLKLYEKKK